MNEDWDLLMSFFPEGWRDTAVTTGAMKGLRKNKSVEGLIHTLLMHIGCGFSLRETVVRAKKAGLADLSDVALLKRMKKSKEWLRSMCVQLFKEQGIALSNSNNFQVRAFDATTIKEPGKTGSLWRLHYSVCLPSLNCDFFKLTETNGVGTGESLKQYPISKGEYILADRAYSTQSGIHYAHIQKAYVTIRLNTSTLPLYDRDQGKFELFKAVKKLKKAGAFRSWLVTVKADNNKIDGRLCAIRKTQHAIALAQKKIRREASKKRKTIKSETLEYAKYVIVFTTFPELQFSTADILEWYRIRWQVELVFKRFKSIAQVGHLPKHDEESSKAWIYGKLLVALLVEKLIFHAEAISPWGFLLEEPPARKRMA